MRPNKTTGVPPVGVSLLVRKLKFYTSPSYLREIFSRFGKIKDLYIPVDYVTRRPRGFGFVEYYNKSDAHMAVRQLDNVEINGSRVEITIAQHGRSSADFMRGRLRNTMRNSQKKRVRSRSKEYNDRYLRDFESARDGHADKLSDKYAVSAYEEGRCIIREKSPQWHENRRYQRSRHSYERHDCRASRYSPYDTLGRQCRDKCEFNKLHGHSHLCGAHDKERDVRKLLCKEAGLYRDVVDISKAPQKRSYRYDELHRKIRAKQSVEAIPENVRERKRSHERRRGRSDRHDIRKRSASLDRRRHSKMNKKESAVVAKGNDFSRNLDRNNLIGKKREDEVQVILNFDTKNSVAEERAKEEDDGSHNNPEESINNCNDASFNMIEEEYECDADIVDDYFTFRRDKSVSVSL